MLNLLARFTSTAGLPSFHCFVVPIHSHCLYTLYTKLCCLAMLDFCHSEESGPCFCQRNAKESSHCEFCFDLENEIDACSFDL